MFHPAVDEGYDVIFLASVVLRTRRSLTHSCVIVVRSSTGVGTINSVFFSAGVTAEHAVGSRR